ncbi:MAG: hypothetical protein ACRDKH_08590 [Solirubrobacterales bacterium]
MSPGTTPEWVPEGLTNKGLGDAAEPPAAEQQRRPGGNSGGDGMRPPIPLDHVERLVGERIAETERRIDARLKTVVADMKRALERGPDRAPTPDPFAAQASPENGDTPALDSEVEGRLREAERRVARAARATERNVDEVRRLLGVRLAAARGVSDGEQEGSHLESAGQNEDRS